jgi:hypothetical protein
VAPLAAQMLHESRSIDAWHSQVDDDTSLNRRRPQGEELVRRQKRLNAVAAHLQQRLDCGQDGSQIINEIDCRFTHVFDRESAD